MLAMPVCISCARRNDASFAIFEDRGFANASASLDFVLFTLDRFFVQTDRPAKIGEFHTFRRVLLGEKCTRVLGSFAYLGSIAMGIEESVLKLEINLAASILIRRRER